MCLSPPMTGVEARAVNGSAVEDTCGETTGAMIAGDVAGADVDAVCRDLTGVDVDGRVVTGVAVE